MSALHPPPATVSTVVIVDDQPANVALLERVLADMAEVHGFTDPRVALEHCRRSLPSIVLLDLHMPDLDGFAVMDALNDLVPDNGLLPVLVLTADVTTDARDRALASGARDFLTKPFDRTEVLVRVSNLLDLRALHDRLERHHVSLRTAQDTHLAEQAGEKTEARELLARTEVAQRLESLGQRVIDAAHDLNNHLGVILNFTTFVERQVEDPASLSDLRQIRTAGEQAVVLTRELSALARQVLIPPEPLGADEFPEGAMPVHATIRILLVEDEGPRRAAISHVLLEHGYEVVLAADGVQALDAFDRHRGIALVICNVALSRIRGEGLERHLIERDPAVRVLALVAHDSNWSSGTPRVLDGSASGADLLAAVRAVLDA